MPGLFVKSGTRGVTNRVSGQTRIRAVINFRGCNQSRAAPRSGGHMTQGHDSSTVQGITPPASHNSVRWVTRYMVSGSAVQIFTCFHHTPQGNHVFSQCKGLMKQRAGELKCVGLGLRSAADRLHPGHFTLCVIVSHLQKTVLIFNYLMVLNCSLINGLQSTSKCSLEIGKG